ncbi:MAG: SIMPL domain-containing protein [Candidatus Krumholzibacteria bacterium]
MCTTRLVASLAAAAIALSWQPVTAQLDGTATISVDGHAEVRVVPDQVILTVGIETFDADLATAKRDNDERVNALFSVAESVGIASKDVRTEFLNIQPHYKDRHDRGNFLRYVVRKTVVVTLRDISEFETLLSRFLESGVNYVHGVEFRTTELQKYRDEAEALAIAAAKDRAKAVAEKLGQNLGKVRSIHVTSSNWRSSYGHWGRAQSRGPQNVVVDARESQKLKGPTAPGHIAITARVSARFDLED